MSWSFYIAVQRMWKAEFVLSHSCNKEVWGNQSPAFIFSLAEQSLVQILSFLLGMALAVPRKGSSSVLHPSCALSNDFTSLLWSILPDGFKHSCSVSSFRGCCPVLSALTGNSCSLPGALSLSCLAAAPA